MKLSIDLKKVPLENRDSVWAANIVYDYRLIDIDYLYNSRETDPLYRLEQAEILRALFTADTCRFVFYSDVEGKWIPGGINVYGAFNTFNLADGLREAMEKIGAVIETDPEECPEVENLLAAFAQAAGITNIAITRHHREAL
jgi:hypothetical protein